jgi:hypothetical protein
MIESTTSRRRGRLLWSVVVAGVLVVAGLVIAVLVTTHHNNQKPPAPVAAPGTVRITHQPSRGAPPPQYVTMGSNRVGVILGATQSTNGRPTAALVAFAYSEPGTPSSALATYAVGDVITLGRVRIKIVAIYVEADQANDAVDVQITRV